MSKWLGLIIVILMIVVGYMYLSGKRFVPEWNKPKTAKVSRGDIRVPISAAGLIEPNQRIEVKSKASGEVIEIAVLEGKFVKKGDVLVVLKPDDEERSVTRSEAALQRAKALLESARVDVLKAHASVDSGKARVDQLVAEGLISETDFKRVERLYARNETVEQEYVTAKSRVEVNQAQQRQAQAELVIAQNNVKAAEENVKIQDAAVTEAQKTLEDAQERLRETTIRAAEDGIVTDVKVRRGEVIQGGQNTITGGTILMNLADVSSKKVVTRVDESDYGRVLDISPLDAYPEMPGLREAVEQSATDIQSRTGKVTLTVDAFPEDKFEGIIERVEPQGQLNAGSSIIQFDVHVLITDENRTKLPLGVQAQVEFTVESAANTLRVPAEAAKSNQGERGVWLVRPPEPGVTEQYGKKFVACRFGITDGEYTQIIEAKGGELKEGDEVYTRLPVSVEDENK